MGSGSLLYSPPSKQPSEKGIIRPTEPTTQETRGCRRLYHESQIPNSKALIPKSHKQFLTNVLTFLSFCSSDILV